MTFEEELNQLSNAIENKIKTSEVKKQLINSEVEQAKKDILEKYKQEIMTNADNIKESEERFHNYCLNMRNKATFNADMIGKALELIITLFEGKEYVFQKTTLNCVLLSKTYARYYISLVIPKKNKKRYYKDSYLNNKTLILSKENFVEDTNNITFYQTRNRKIVSTIMNIQEFPYIKDFIDILINYRMENNVSNLNEEELNIILNKFLEERKEEIPVLDKSSNKSFIKKLVNKQ